MINAPLPALSDTQERAIDAMYRGEVQRHGAGWAAGARWWGNAVMGSLEDLGLVLVQRFGHVDGRAWLTPDGRAAAEALQ